MNDRSDVPRAGQGAVSDKFVQINQDIPYRSVLATGFGIAVGVGVMAMLGRFVISYDPRESVVGYLLLVLFVIPFLLTYGERVEAQEGHGGLYSLVRERYGLTLAFLVGWLELAGYTVIIVLLARVVASYGLTVYGAFGEELVIPVSWLTIGIVLMLILFMVAGIHGSRKLNTALAFAGLIFMVILGVISLMHYRQDLSRFPATLATIAPFKLSALLLGSFWGVVMLFGVRHRVQKSGENAIARVGSTIMLITIGLGLLLSVAIVPFAPSDLLAAVLTVNERATIVFSGEPIYTVLIGLFSILIALMGLSRGLEACVEVMAQMTADGYFPPSFNYRLRQAIFPPLLFVALLAIPLALFTTTAIVLGMATAFLLWATILIHFPDVLRSEPRLPAQRSIRLPYHPLFPALTVVAATLGAVNLPFDALKWAGVWLLVGGALLGLYSHSRALEKRATKRTFSEEKAPSATEAFQRTRPSGAAVLAFVRGPEDMSHMIGLGARLAKSIDASLIVMQIAQVPDEFSEAERRERGAQAWRALAARMREIPLPVSEVAVRPMVRVAQDVISGLINAAEELQPQYLLISPRFMADDPAQNLEEYDEILRNAAGHVVFLNRFPPDDKLERIAIFIDTGIQSAATLTLANAFLSKDGLLEVIHALSAGASKADEAKTLAHLRSILQANGLDEHRVRISLLRGRSLEEAVEEAARRADLLLLGANKNFMTRRAVFGGANAHLFQHSSAAIMLVARREKIRFAWLSRLWEALTRPLPKLTLEERLEAAQNILSGADPTVDFFILILLSAGIATYGLLQNSGAVIIGAMLVAPLMSPIVAIAMSMVRGRVKTLGLAVQATAQGVLLAISVGAILTFFSPIKEPTNEIMGRVSPNLLDLSIAFLSGAAGAYAMSRKSIASALPGVSIAVALVPPLAVVGFGFATADLNIAFGALLLFSTNLVAIVLAASLVFIALDFLTTEKQTWAEIIRGLKVTLAFLVIVMFILGWVTYDTVSNQRRLRAIDQVLNQNLYSQSFRPLEIKVTGNRKGYVIKATLLGYDKPLSSSQVERLGEELEKAVGAPVTVDLTAIAAQTETFDFDAALTMTRLEEAASEAIEALPVQILDIKSEPIIPEGYRMTISVMEFEPNAFTAATVAELENALSQQFTTPIELQVYVIPVEKLESRSGAPPDAEPTSGK
ncbi:MAG: amino acid permease [Chloroflexi bacterium]|nr:amino acid permease [Chloroflexota bacterium]